MIRLALVAVQVELDYRMVLHDMMRHVHLVHSVAGNQHHIRELFLQALSSCAAHIQ